MISSILIKFKSQENLKIRGRGEEAVFQLLLDVLRKRNQTLAHNLLTRKSEKPVTLSPLLKGAKFSGGHAYLTPRERTSFRITCLQEYFLEPVVQGFFSLSAVEEPVQFAHGKIDIEKVDLQKATPAHFISFEQLLEEAQPESRITLEFCSPTSFGNVTGELIFPVPRLVFSSLLKKWNTFSKTKLPPDIKKEFEKIRIQRFNLKTASTYLNKEEILGFIGTAAYKLPPSTDKEKSRMINALANFAFYSGIGTKTESGMGQARRKDDESNSKNG